MSKKSVDGAIRLIASRSFLFRSSSNADEYTQIVPAGTGGAAAP
jgi:hypothetical protein